MGKCYSDAVERALQYIYYDLRAGKGAEGFALLGVIYGRGLGVPEDIKKGVAYLQKAGNNREAKEELIHYKKTFFGKWVRR